MDTNAMAGLLAQLLAQHPEAAVGLVGLVGLYGSYRTLWVVLRTVLGVLGGVGRWQARRQARHEEEFRRRVWATLERRLVYDRWELPRPGPF